MHGCTKDVLASVAVNCDTCDGSGSADKSKPVTCTACKGTGQQAAANGFFSVVTTCR